MRVSTVATMLGLYVSQSSSRYPKQFYNNENLPFLPACHDAPVIFEFPIYEDGHKPDLNQKMENQVRNADLYRVMYRPDNKKSVVLRSMSKPQTETRRNIRL